ncbi:alpha/beta hydrolase [Chitinophaga japonensis]|uniref:Prolyl oligopeptidase family protein n=1 Tax=Chitinophaga japonensis TaxID=104662 RepID=A0A562TDQ4_CHIJA|nr:alpha/beta hydrolase [Chitinophaga japonensis]TWI91691.1 prolyl oligopeptidase family protein [Chitinophaga japonensis]
MMKNVLTALLLGGSLATVQAQEKIYLYPGQQNLHIGGREHIADAPYIAHYSAPGKNGAAVLVCPGGGYTFLAAGHEGKDIAQFFTSQGYDAIVLHYRVNDEAQQGARYPDQYNDVTTAMRLVKSRAAAWGLNPEKIGVIGFSAGGHLASCLATMIQPGRPQAEDTLEQWSTRPAFAILVYPVISLIAPYKHAGSAEMLLGREHTEERADSLSTYQRVTAQTPPTLLIHSTDDDVVPVENSLLFYKALKGQQVPATLHIYDHGGHGYGMAVKDPVLSSWPGLCIAWLQRVVKK